MKGRANRKRVTCLPHTRKELSMIRSPGSQTRLGIVGGMDTCHLVLELETGRSLGLYGPKLRGTIEDYTDSQPLVSTLTHTSAYPHAQVHSHLCTTR